MDPTVLQRIFFSYYPLNKKTLNFIKKGLVLLWQVKLPGGQCVSVPRHREAEQGTRLPRGTVHGPATCWAY